MHIDLAAGSRYSPRSAPPTRFEAMTATAPKILVFDSGLGGLTVLTEIAKARPDAELVYVADDAAFPYGSWPAAELKGRVVDVVGRLVDSMQPDVCVIACNTISTLVLGDLRAAFPDLPFVGTVPAIKPAAAQSRSKLISVLATPGTVARDYTHALVATFAAGCAVTLVGSTVLASLAETAMAGDVVADDAIAAEIAPCFVVEGERRTDAIVLACTHYPLLVDRFAALAPWPVVWLDPAPAIARRVDTVVAEAGFATSSPRAAPIAALFTSGRTMSPAVARAFESRGLSFARGAAP